MLLEMGGLLVGVITFHYESAVNLGDQGYPSPQIGLTTPQTQQEVICSQQLTRTGSAVVLILVYRKAAADGMTLHTRGKLCKNTWPAVFLHNIAMQLTTDRNLTATHAAFLICLITYVTS